MIEPNGAEVIILAPRNSWANIYRNYTVVFLQNVVNIVVTKKLLWNFIEYNGAEVIILAPRKSWANIYRNYTAVFLKKCGKYCCNQKLISKISLT